MRRSRPQEGGPHSIRLVVLGAAVDFLILWRTTPTNNPGQLHGPPLLGSSRSRPIAHLTPRPQAPAPNPISKSAPFRGLFTADLKPKAGKAEGVADPCPPHSKKKGWRTIFAAGRSRSHDPERGTVHTARCGSPVNTQGPYQSVQCHLLRAYDTEKTEMDTGSLGTRPNPGTEGQRHKSSTTQKSRCTHAPARRMDSQQGPPGTT